MIRQKDRWLWDHVLFVHGGAVHPFLVQLIGPLNLFDKIIIQLPQLTHFFFNGLKPSQSHSVTLLIMDAARGVAPVIPNRTYPYTSIAWLSHLTRILAQILHAKLPFCNSVTC
jgi:hypothetical protein